MARPQCVHENAGTDPDYKMTKIDNKYRFQYDWPAAGKTPRQGRAGLPSTRREQTSNGARTGKMT